MSSSSTILCSKLKQEPTGLLSATTENEQEPAWALQQSLLKAGRAAADSNCCQNRRAPLKAEPISGIDGAFIVHAVLSPDECHALVALADNVGFTTGRTLVEVPESVRKNEVAVIVPPVEMVTELSSRLSAVIPVNGAGATKRCDPDFINRRWRVYKYHPPDDALSPQANSGSFFKPHYDAAQPKSGIRDGTLIDDEPAKGIVRLSQMSVLLYLTDGHEGGETVFYPTGEATDEGAVRISPLLGAALCFYHGHHPLSPLHEGAPLKPSEGASPKYVIRTDVLFTSEPPQQNSGEWSSSSYASAMLRAALGGHRVTQHEKRKS